MDIINMTQHTISIVDEEGNLLVTVPPSGEVARVATTRTVERMLDAGDGVEVPIYATAFGAVEGLPAPEAGVVYIVSALVAGATGRPDVVSPGELVRGPDGQPIGCRGLSRPA